MASALLLPALVQERAALEPIATVSVLLALRPVVSQLLQAVENLADHEAQRLDSLLQRTGSAIVFRGHPSAARHLEARLRQVGLTTSTNLLAQPVIV
jgi:ATP-dependent Clp protease adapter protein ClpS